MGSLKSTFNTFKERKIGNVAAVYLGTAWVLTEAFSFLSQRYQWPASLIDVVLVLALIGLPVAVTFQWFQYESMTRQRIRKLVLLYIFFGTSMVVFGYMVYQREDVTVYQPLLSEKSVAVMPFANLDHKIEEEYFSDGIMEDIISKLYKIADLQVTSRTSSLMYKNTSKNIHQIASELGVAYIVEGSVRKNKNAIRVTARLINAKNDQNIWTETYDKPLEDIFALQNDLSEKIAYALKAKITSGEKELIEKIPTRNTTAYQYYQQARYYLSLPGQGNIVKAKNLFKKAVQEDPSFSLAYAGLAESFISLVDWGYGIPATYSDSIKLPLQIALQQDPMLGEAYSGLAAYHLYMHDFSASERAATRALELNPGGDFGYYHYATLCAATDQQQKSISLISKGLSLNPLSSKFNGYKIQFLFFAGHSDEAIAEGSRLLNLFPDDDFILWSLACALTQNGKYDEAINDFKKRKVDPNGNNWALAYTYAKKGEKDKARKIATFLVEKSKTNYVPPTFIGLIYLALGETETAVDYFEKGYAQKDTFSIFYHGHPWFKEVSENPRFKKLLNYEVSNPSL